jgi:hypothetical protein
MATAGENLPQLAVAGLVVEGRVVLRRRAFAKDVLPLLALFQLDPGPCNVSL